MPSFEHSVDRVLNGSLALGIKCRCLRNLCKKKERTIELSKENLDTILIIMRYKSASCSKCYTYRLIEQKNARAPHQSSGNRHPLLLPARELHSTLCNLK